MLFCPTFYAKFSGPLLVNIFRCFRPSFGQFSQFSPDFRQLLSISVSFSHDKTLEFPDLGKTTPIYSTDKRLPTISESHAERNSRRILSLRMAISTHDPLPIQKGLLCGEQEGLLKKRSRANRHMHQKARSRKNENKEKRHIKKNKKLTKKETIVIEIITFCSKAIHSVAAIAGNS